MFKIETFQIKSLKNKNETISKLNKMKLNIFTLKVFEIESFVVKTIATPSLKFDNFKSMYI